MNENDIEAFIQSVISQRLTFRRLAGNTLILYLNCNPGDNHGYSVWLEPTWNFSNNTQVLVGSRQAQVESEQELDAIGRLMDGLDNKEIESISIDPVSYDIHIRFEHGYFVKTFVADPTDDFTWYVYDAANKLKLLASPNGVDIVQS